MRYEDRGASADKTEVHQALAGRDPGLFPGAFCKVLPDLLSGSPDHCFLLHADGAGTKSIVAYLHWRETGDAGVFRGIAQDSLVMNLDDLLCVGARGPFLLSNTIGRNAKRIPGEIVKEIIAGYEDIAALLAPLGIRIESCGGETADLGDVVRTVIVDSTLACRERRDRIITGEAIRPGLAIVGLASFGRATYEKAENSGMGSNGYTAVRHEVLSPHYRDAYPEAYAPEIRDLAYTGRHRLSDPLPGSSLTLGEALLSPTRTYAPILVRLLERLGPGIAAVFNNTGGGLGKCLRFGKSIRYVKDNLFPAPPLFALLRRESAMPARELYRTLNMGQRLEVLVEEKDAARVQAVALEFGVAARILGHTERSATGANEVLVRTPDEQGADGRPGEAGGGAAPEEFIYTLG